MNSTFFFLPFLPVGPPFDQDRGPRHDVRLAPEVRARRVVAAGRERPRDLVRRALPKALRHDVAVAGVADVPHVRPAVHPPVGDEYEASEAQRPDGLFHRGPQRVVVERVAGEHPDGQRDAFAVHEQPQLDDGLPPVLLADAHLAKALHGVPTVVPRVPVGPLRLEEEVGHVVEHQARLPPRAARDAGVHAPDDLLRVRVDHVQRVVDAAVVRAVRGRAVPQVVLPHRRALRRRIQEPAVHEQPHDALQVVPDIRRELDAGEQLVQSERLEHGVQNHRGHALRLAEARRVALREGQRHGLAVRGPGIWLKCLDERPAVVERLPQPRQIARLAVVVARERPYGEHALAPLDGLPAPILHAPRLNEPEVWYAVVLEELDRHGYYWVIMLCMNYSMPAG